MHNFPVQDEFRLNKILLSRKFISDALSTTPKMHQFSDFSEPYRPGGSSYHGYHSNFSPQSSSFTGYSANRLHEYHGAARTTRSPKAPNIENLTMHTPTPSPYPVSPATTPGVSIPEPQISPPSTQTNIPSISRFEDMKASIKSYIADRKPLIPLKYDLSWEEFVAFREEAKESVPGWEKLSYVITSSKTTSSS